MIARLVSTLVLVGALLATSPRPVSLAAQSPVGRTEDYRNTVLRFVDQPDQPLIEMGLEGDWSNREGWRSRRYYLWKFDAKNIANGVSIVHLDAPTADVSDWMLNVNPGDCMPDAALPGWRCGVDLVKISKRRHSSRVVRYGDDLFTPIGDDGGSFTPLVEARQRRGHVTVRVDPRCVRVAWGATCPKN